MAYAQESIDALNRLIGDDGLLMYSVITVGCDSFVIIARLTRFMMSKAAGNKFKICLCCKFDGVEYDKMTEMFHEAVRRAQEMYGVDIYSSNFDCWGRFEVALARGGLWMSATMRDLVMGTVRKGQAPFDISQVAFRKDNVALIQAHSSGDPTQQVLKLPALTIAKGSRCSSGESGGAAAVGGSVRKRKKTASQEHDGVDAEELDRRALAASEGMTPTAGRMIGDFRSAIEELMGGKAAPGVDPIKDHLSKTYTGQDLKTLLFQFTPFDEKQLRDYGRRLARQTRPT